MTAESFLLITAIFFLLLVCSIVAFVDFTKKPKKLIKKEFSQWTIFNKKDNTSVVSFPTKEMAKSTLESFVDDDEYKKDLIILELKGTYNVSK